MFAEEVAGVAFVQAHDCITGAVVKGLLGLRCRINMHDEAGKLVASLLFAGALEIAR
jgi:hypothetical protein